MVDARVAIIDNGGGAEETDTIPKIGFVSIIISSFYNAFSAIVEVYSLKGPNVFAVGIEVFKLNSIVYVFSFESSFCIFPFISKNYM